MSNKSYLFIPFILCATALSCTQNKNTQQNAPKKENSIKATSHSSSQWAFDKINGSVLQFKNNRKYQTGLYELKYIGQIENGSKAPFLIFSGRDCDECDANISLYIHSPDDGHLDVTNGQHRFGLPGTERDFATDSLLYQARAFYGNVLPGIKGAIWYQQQLMEDGSWQKSVFMVKINSGHIVETTTRDSNQLKETLNLLNQGLCKEIQGTDYKSEP